MTITQIVNKVYFLTKTNSTSYTAANMLLSINNAYERLASLIMQADGRWKWDDSNQTDLPIATTTLTASQQDYSLATTHLSIERIEVKDTTGLWTELTPIDQNDLKGESLTEFMKTPSIPTYYDKIGSSIFLYPPPNYTQSASLKVYFQRGPALYTSAEVTTGTKEPGINSLYHDIISLWAAYDYAMANNLAAGERFMREIQRREDALLADYQMRNKDEPLKMRTVRTTSR